MDNHLRAEVTLSGPLAKGSTFLGEFLPRLAEETLSRTLGKRGRGQLVEWELIEDRLTLVIESEGARPHQSLLAILRRLGDELGRREKVGVRGIRLPLYRVRFPI